MNIAAFLDAPAREDPGRAALIVDDAPVTYGALHEEVGRWAATLAAAGIGAGDHVALADWGGTRSTAVTLAAAHLGAASAQMNPLLTSDELAQLATVAACRPVGVADAGAAAALRKAVGEVIEVPSGSPSPPPRAPGGAADALILFTSGTTGLPKAVPISHDMLVKRITEYRPAFSAERPPNVGMMCVPSFHVGGMLGLLLALWGGDTTVVLPRFDAGRWIDAVERHRAASSFLVPTMLARILDHPRAKTADLSSLRAISYGAAAAPVALVTRAMEVWPDVGFMNTFGQTETLGGYTALTPDDHRDPARIGSVGRVLPGVEVRIVDPASGADVPDGETGEVWVRSAQNVVEGWLHTGDLARRDPDGYIYPSGRMSETINRGGEKFAPSEVAEVVRAHPAVADVGVAGVPDEEMGERVGVAVKVRAGTAPPTLEELREFCRGRLAPFKLPERLVVVDVLPYNETGKLPRRAIAALF
ncbi:MAG TPA: class I adenylate-forming enzyme family protein [Acidimicrobiales bacterium]|nr:class I adenylate-forming enzyme family protein [Acidimicrobiales bacterium]